GTARLRGGLLGGRDGCEASQPDRSADGREVQHLPVASGAARGTDAIGAQMATLVTSSAGLEGGISDVRSFLTNLKFFALKFPPSTSYATGGDVIPAGSLPGGLKVADFVTGPSGNIIPLNAGQLSIN